MNTETAQSLFGYIAWAGFIAHVVYLYAVVAIERKYIRMTGATFEFLPRVRFQNILGNLAMLGCLGYLIVGRMLGHDHNFGRWAAFMASFILFCAALMRFQVAQTLKQIQNSSTKPRA